MKDRFLSGCLVQLYSLVPSDERYSPSNRSLSSRRASLLSRRNCFSISWLMRFCSLASSDRQHAIAAALLSAPCGPAVHHDDGGRTHPLLPAAMSTGRTHHHHHHQRGQQQQQQQTPRATPQWPQRRYSLKSHCLFGRPRPPPPPRRRCPLAAVRHPLGRRRQPAARHRPRTHTSAAGDGAMVAGAGVTLLLRLVLLMVARGSRADVDAPNWRSALPRRRRKRDERTRTGDGPVHTEKRTRSDGATKSKSENRGETADRFYRDYEIFIISFVTHTRIHIYT